jgi:uncharacterized protein (TIGR02646 family)
MRPLERGAAPTERDPGTGLQVPVSFPTYAHARPHLLRRMGAWCCYCEIPLTSTLAVEHVVAKAPSPGLITTWTNLLLVCNNCNATKNDLVATPADLTSYLWPDQDRTFDLIMVQAPGRIRVRPTATPAEAAKADATLRLCGLQVEPGAGMDKLKEETMTDLRWMRRHEIWRIAERDRDRLLRGGNRDFRDSIVEKAKLTGFFSIWLTIFQDDAQMVSDLISAFQGTSTARLLPLPKPA